THHRPPAASAVCCVSRAGECDRHFFFFFQAEDGIRDGHVTGVQTCALPIFREYITESVISPGTYVVKPFPDGVMPKVFGQKLSAGALNKIVDYLSQVEEGKEPPKI